MMQWTLQQALDYIRSMQPATTKAGWCILLGGGVLNKGHGKDLDLLLYPMTKTSMIEDAIACFPYAMSVSCVEVAVVYSFTTCTGHLVELIVQKNC